MSTERLIPLDQLSLPTIQGATDENLRKFCEILESTFSVATDELTDGQLRAGELRDRDMQPVPDSLGHLPRWRIETGREEPPALRLRLPRVANVRDRLQPTGPSECAQSRPICILLRKHSICVRINAKGHVWTSGNRGGDLRSR